MIRINSHLKEQEVQFDEDEQTAQDYSIVIKNPPSDATNPEEWKSFFENKFGRNNHVTCCTVAKDNHTLLKELVRRREILQKIKWKLPQGTSLDEASLTMNAYDLEQRQTIFQRIKAVVVPDIIVLFKQLVRINSKVKKFASIDVTFPATRVFITFETESAQRHILKHLSVGSKRILKSEKLNIDDNYLFRANKALHVKEADEPSTIRWHDLSDDHWMRIIKFMLTTYAWSVGMILVAFIVTICRNKSAQFSAYAIAFFNGIFPEFAKILANYESHGSEDKLESSLYVKIAAFRWINESG